MNKKFCDLLRNDALTFAQQVHLELHQTPLNDDSYIRLLTFDIERIASGHFKRYGCNIGPGMGKTSLFGVALPAWILGHKPSARILITSYGDDLATDISRKTRAIVRANWYRMAFPRTILAPDHRSARDFATKAGGQVYARSIDGGTTGIRCDYLIIDDPVKIRDSADLAQLEWVNTIFDTELENRLNNPLTGTIVIVHHRLNQCDLTGHVLKRGDFKHRRLPLVATEDRVYRLKEGVWDRKAGDILRPDAFSSDYIARLREITGAPGFGPLYQQSFIGPDVLQVRREDFLIKPFYAPPAAPYILSIDANHKGENGQSYGVIQCWGVLSDGELYLLYDQWRGRAHRSVFADHIRHMKSRYRPRAILIEDNGPALDLHAQFDSSACPVILLQPHGDKLSRLRPHLDLFRKSRVVLRAGAPFLNELIGEFEQFPYGEHDDQVDTATQFFEWIRSNDLPPATPQPGVMGALGSIRKTHAMLYWNGGRPSGPYVFSRR